MTCIRGAFDLIVFQVKRTLTPALFFDASNVSRLCTDENIVKILYDI